MKLIGETRQNNFDAIRLAMALLVIWSHSFALHLGSEQSEWISLLLNGAYNAGNLAVMGFFVISGFLIAQSYERSDSWRSYMVKRVRRIYPGFLVAVGLCAFAVVPLFSALPISWNDAAKTVGLSLVLHSSFPKTGVFESNLSHTVNGSLWSIPYEFWCYIGVALTGSLLLGRRKILVATLVSVLLLRVYCDLMGKQPGLGTIGVIFGWPYLWTKMLPSFLVGMVVYSYRAELPRSATLLSGCILAAVVACNINRSIADLIVSPVLAYAVFMTAYSNNIPLQGAARYGDFSYGVYLYAFPIQQILQATVGKNWNIGQFVAASMALSLIAGILSWHLVEKHFLPRRPDRKTSAQMIAAPA